ncbi:MAG: hypothetical protein JW728_05470 [Candidatus Aureabacteria bacterium]|nr:hypothetical protein [Candidatus Auribacterota bacterium]
MKKLVFAVILTIMFAIPGVSYAKTKSPDECFRDYIDAIKLQKEKTIEKYVYGLSKEDIEDQKKEYAKSMKSQGMADEDIIRELKRMEETTQNIRSQIRMQGDAVMASFGKLELKSEKIDGVNACVTYVASVSGLAQSMYNDDKVFLEVTMKKIGNIWKVISVNGTSLKAYLEIKKQELEQKKEEMK